LFLGRRFILDFTYYIDKDILWPRNYGRGTITEEVATVLMGGVETQDFTGEGHFLA
jgi:hypothetical protein